jgi:hypothetical protein
MKPGESYADVMNSYLSAAEKHDHDYGYDRACGVEQDRRQPLLD